MSIDEEVLQMDWIIHLSTLFVSFTLVAESDDMFVCLFGKGPNKNISLIRGVLLRYPNKSKRPLVDQIHKGEQTYPRGLPDKGKRHWHEIVSDLPNIGAFVIGLSQISSFFSC